MPMMAWRTTCSISPTGARRILAERSPGAENIERRLAEPLLQLAREHLADRGLGDRHLALLHQPRIAQLELARNLDVGGERPDAIANDGIAAQSLAGHHRGAQILGKM